MEVTEGRWEERDLKEEGGGQESTGIYVMKVERGLFAEKQKGQQGKKPWEGTRRPKKEQIMYDSKCHGKTEFCLLAQSLITKTIRSSLAIVTFLLIN